MNRPFRIQLRKGWKRPPNTVAVIGKSKWATPFILQKWVDRTAKKRCPKLIAHQCAKANYRDWLDKYHFRDAAIELKGKNLACHCPLDMPCHADILLEIANK